MDTLPANGASNCFARVASGSVPVCTRIRASENRPVSNYRTVGRTPGRTPGLHLQLASGRNPEENTAMHPPPHVPCFASLLLLSIAASAADAPKPAPKYELVDGHLHFLSFVQETDGMDAFLKAMDDTGVTESVVIGMPVVKKWDEGDETWD